MINVAKIPGNKSRNVIQNVQITQFREDSTGFTILPLNEAYEKYYHLLSDPHRNNFYQLILISQGKGLIRIDSRQYEYLSKNIFAVAKGQVELFELTKDMTGFLILFTEDYIHKFPGDLEWINDLKLFDLSAHPFIVGLSENEYAETMSLLKRIIFELGRCDDFAKNDILINLLKTLLLISERVKREKMNGVVTNIVDWDYIVDFKKKLEENYCSTRFVNFYADELNITQKKLNHVTSIFWGKPAKQVIEERVLLEIKRLLLYTNQTIKEIGISLGFNDPTNFNKFFKRYMHATPADYRHSSKRNILYHKTALFNHPKDSVVADNYFG